jgi:polar amino acid transport system permease protein
MEVLIKSAPILLEALGQTLLLSFFTMVFAVPLGFLLAEAAQFPSPVFRWLLRRYIDVIRGIPVLVFLFLVYYMLPFFEIRPTSFVSSIVALSLYFSGFVAEIVRGAIETIPRGQLQSALALGMSRLRAEFIVIIPQAMRIALPALLNLSSIAIKSTSLVSIVGVWELTYATREIVTRTVKPFELFIAAMVIYFIVCYSLVLLNRILERRLARGYQ